MTEPRQVARAPNRPLILVLILGALLFGWITWRMTTGKGEPTQAALECQDRYANAKSSVDTALVDRSYPKDYVQGGRSPSTCGDLRRRAPR
jgi:hypothetical protein